jgi:hypothetical protein
MCMTLQDIARLIDPLGWRILPSFDLKRVVITAILSRPVVANMSVVEGVLTLAGIQCEQLNGYAATLVLHFPEPILP